MFGAVVQLHNRGRCFQFAFCCPPPRPLACSRTLAPPKCVLAPRAAGAWAEPHTLTLPKRSTAASFRSVAHRERDDGVDFRQELFVKRAVLPPGAVIVTAASRTPKCRHGAGRKSATSSRAQPTNHCRSSQEPSQFGARPNPSLDYSRCGRRFTIGCYYPDYPWGSLFGHSAHFRALRSLRIGVVVAEPTPFGARSRHPTSTSCTPPCLKTPVLRRVGQKARKSSGFTAPRSHEHDRLALTHSRP